MSNQQYPTPYKGKTTPHTGRARFTTRKVNVFTNKLNVYLDKNTVYGDMVFRDYGYLIADYRSLLLQDNGAKIIL